MQIIEWNAFLENDPARQDDSVLGQKPASVTVGVFDGVHRGHRALIKRIVSHGENASGNSANISAAGCLPVVVTFRSPDHKDTGNIQTFEERAAMLETLGVEILIVIDFTESFKHMGGIEFLETLLRHADIGFFAVGSNFRCGYNLDTDAAAIRDFFTKRGIPAEIVPEVLHEGLPISSSRIRAALKDGDIELAKELIG